MTKQCMDKQLKVRRKYSPAVLFKHLMRDGDCVVFDRSADWQGTVEGNDVEMQVLMHTVYGWDFADYDKHTIYFEFNDDGMFIGGIYNLETKQKETAELINGQTSPYHYSDAVLEVFRAKYKQIFETP